MKMKIIKGILYIGVLIGLAGCATDNTEVPKKLTAFKPTMKVGVMWRQSTGGGSGKQFLDLPLTHGQNTIYVPASSGKITALNTQNGAIVWQHKIGESITSGIGVGQNSLVVSTNRAKLFSLNRQTGKKQWSVELPALVEATPAVAAQKVVVHMNNGQIRALSQKDGHTLWTYRSDNQPVLSLTGSGTPVIAGQVVYCGLENGLLVALNLDTGQVIWSQPVAIGQGSSDVSRMVDVEAKPIVQYGVVYEVSYQGNVVAMQASNGRTLWQHPMSSFRDMALSDGVLYVTDAKSHVWALDANSGQTIWTQPALEARFVSAPQVVPNAVVVGDYQGYLHYLSPKDGQFMARVQLSGGAIKTQPVRIGNGLYALTADGQTYRVQV